MPEASVTPDKYVSLESLKVVSTACEPVISTNIAPVTVLPASLIEVIYSADSPASKSLTTPAAEKPLEVPLALSTIELGCPSPLFTKARPPLLEVVKDG